MSDDRFYFELHDPLQGHQVMVNAIWPKAKEQLQLGRELAVRLEELEDAKTVEQGNYLWGVVYKEMSEVGQLGGQRYSPDAYHELMKRLYLPRVKKKVHVAGRKRPVVTTTIGTTKGIGVRRMAAFIDSVIAFSATECGWAVSEPMPAHLRPNARKAAPLRKREFTDADADGVITEIAA